jgi:hypothetical protein
MIATSFSRRALLRWGGLAALGLAAQGCSKFVVTLYPYMGNDLRMIATDLNLLFKTLQSCCDNADTGAFFSDLAAIANDVNATVTAIWPATQVYLSAPEEDQVLRIAVDVNDFIDTVDKLADAKRLPDPVLSTATTVLGAILALLRPIEAAHNLAVKPGAPPPHSRPALATLATPLRSHSIRAAAERHAATLSPDQARSELAAIQFPGA